jgi:hypothetical protein
MERATFASSIRARIERVLSDIDSRPVPSLCSRICLTSGHFESSVNIFSIQFFAAGAKFSRLTMSWCIELSEQKQTRLEIHADCSRRGGLTMIGNKMETSITAAIT